MQNNLTDEEIAEIEIGLKITENDNKVMAEYKRRLLTKLEEMKQKT